MQKRHVNIILGVVAVVVVICVVLVAGGAWFALSVMHREDADEQAALVAFDAARAKFSGAKPLFELRVNGPALTREIPASGPGNLHTLHILNWDADEQSLMRADLPFALLRLKEGPIDLANGFADDFSSGRVSIRVSEIERLGPALLLDNKDEAGDHILIWTD
jgi:hypothetical protein